LNEPPYPFSWGLHRSSIAHRGWKMIRCRSPSMPLSVASYWLGSKSCSMSECFHNSSCVSFNFSSYAASYSFEY
jgi:hypothetical protein